MERPASIILVQGLGDDKRIQNKAYDLALSGWKGFNHEIFRMGWHDDEEYELKLNRLLRRIDIRLEKNEKVSLLLISAGFAGGANAALERINDIHRVVNIAGRARDGGYKGFRSLKQRSKNSSSWESAVRMFEEREPSLTDEKRKKFMTIRAWNGFDELVPEDTTIIEGAYNIEIPMVEHMATIYSALTIYRNRIIEFLSD